jgi:hypothetical protein
MNHFLRNLAIPLVACSMPAVAQDVVYLKCKADPQYVGQPEVVIDRQKKTLRVVPIKEALALMETDEAYSGEMRIQETVTFAFSVNRFTLRYTTQSLIGGFAAGQCVAETRKL